MVSSPPSGSGSMAGSLRCPSSACYALFGLGGQWRTSEPSTKSSFIGGDTNLMTGYNTYSEATPATNQRLCSMCGASKEQSEFYESKGRLTRKCKECYKAVQRERTRKGLNKTDPVKSRERTKRYAEKHAAEIKRRKSEYGQRVKRMGRDTERHKRIRSGEEDRPDRVPAQAWSKFLYKLKDDRGFTNQQMADFLGTTKGMCENWMYMRTLPPKKEVAEQMLRKVHNQPRQLNAKELEAVEKRDFVYLPGGEKVKRCLM